MGEDVRYREEKGGEMEVVWTVEMNVFLIEGCGPKFQGVVPPVGCLRKSCQKYTLYNLCLCVNIYIKHKATKWCARLTALICLTSAAKGRFGKGSVAVALFRAVTWDPTWAATAEARQWRFTTEQRTRHIKGEVAMQRDAAERRSGAARHVILSERQMVGASGVRVCPGEEGGFRPSRSQIG